MGEVVDCLRNCQDKILAEGAIGDIRPSCLEIAIKVVIKSSGNDVMI
jgi:hypothetical protein